jgi:phage replication O-like protein O
MASPQLEDGYTRIANELLDALIRCCPGFTEGQILLFIIRMTYGWHKKEDFISIGQIGQGVNKSRRMVIYALQNLEAKHMITVKRMRGAGHLNEINAISLNKNHEQWVVQEKAEQYKKVLDNRKLQYKNSKDKVVQEIEGSARNGKGVVQEMVKNVRFLAPSKERKKEEKEIRAELEIPSWISSECFESFKEMRKKIKKPMTKRAEELVIKELGKLKEKGSDPNEVLEQSIRNDWQDVYPIKEKGNGNQKTRSAVDEGLARFLASEDDPRRD